MSKELTALEVFKELIDNINDCKRITEYSDNGKREYIGYSKDNFGYEVNIDIIETELKNAEDRHKRAKWANNKIEQDLVSIIEEKQKNAESQLLGNHDLDKRERLKGEIEAYYDIICLIKFKYGIEK